MGRHCRLKTNFRQALSKPDGLGSRSFPTCSLKKEFFFIFFFLIFFFAAAVS